MASIPGVTAYVARTYKEQQAARRALIDYIRAHLDEGEFSSIPQVMANVSDLVKKLMNLSVDLGSMRRLLADLQMEDQKTT